MEDSPPQPQSRDSQLLIPDLPNDISLQCIARVPHIHHSNLSLVSKSWNSLLRSSHFFDTRFNLNSTETRLFINIRVRNSSNKWYFFDPKNPKSPFPVPPIPVQSIGSAFAEIGHIIYVIGGSINDIPSPNVWVFDSLAREFAAAGVVHGRIYVIGGCLVDSWFRSSHWAEVFDPVEGEWEAVPSPVDVKEKRMHRCAVIGDKELSWDVVKTEIDLGWRGRATVVDGILFCYDYLGKIKVFDENVGWWRELKGLVSGLHKFLCGATMANVGGNLCVLWERKGMGKEMEICCAEISIREDSCGGSWGSIVWSQIILVVPNGASVVHCLAVGL
ncbi:hypothetical protein MKW98_001051 [Papaver atlanticum]|uniref:F-box domain-containing protein n=1 Tax=Papaver atlanticum TaxID=357466 RepID=A0AAD4X5U6_9MAGN|nr:hypothetical protein MKW98_001051 [Papaver atlanticum]